MIAAPIPTKTAGAPPATHRIVSSAVVDCVAAPAAYPPNPIPQAAIPPPIPCPTLRAKDGRA
jgi:hypothetical protein